MALHPEIEGLLVALEQSPLSWVAQIARDRLNLDGDPEDPRKGAMEDQFSQLSSIDAVVGGIFRRELELTEALRKTAPELGVSQVVVLTAPDRSDEGRVDPLFNPDRQSSIVTFLRTWETARSSVAQAFEDDLRGE